MNKIQDKLHLALEFGSYLPEDLPAPTDIGFDEDGDTRLDWDYGSRQVMSVSISESRKINYAALVGKNPYHGQINFSNSIPEEVLKGIRHAVNNEPF